MFKKPRNFTIKAHKLGVTMAVSETDTSDCNSDSSVDGSKQGDRKERLFTKIVVRRLPPSMNKESFVNQVSPLPDFDYMYFVKADMSLGEFAFSRAYINFRNPTDIFIFKEKFDNYVFLDAKGNEYTAVVEFAPFSRIPKKRNKTRCDPKIGTVESDPLYTEFVESLTEVSNETEEKPEYCFQPSPEDDKKVVNTPLLDFIKQRRIDRQKIREEKREDRKRREIERKRIKEEERKGRKRIEHISHNTTKIATKQNATLDIIDENKLESSPKGKDKRTDDYRSRGGKVNTKDYADKRASYASKDRAMEQRKSPSKIRQRERSQMEKEPKRAEYKSKRDETRHRKDDKTAEKKVKKYSERREERRSEFKKQDAKLESNADKIDAEKVKTEVKSEGNKKEVDENVFVEEKEKEERVYSDTEPLEHVKENFKGHREHREHRDREHRDRDHDPRTQRRIRNKDRPTMAIYQPGQFRKKRPTDNSDDGQKCSGSDTTTKSQ